MESDKIWTRKFFFLMISLLLMAGANYYFASTVALYAKLITPSGFYIGLAAAAFYVASVSMRLINGTLVQNFGSYRIMMISAAIGTIVCYMHQYATTIFLLIILRIMHGFAYSMFNTASGTAASFLVPRSRISEGIGYFAIGNVLALAIGPVIALMIIKDGTFNEFQRLFMVASIFCAVAFLLVSEISKKSTKVPLTLQKINKDNLPPTFIGFEKGVLLPVIISFMMTFSYAPVFVYLAGYGLSRGWGSIGNAYFMYAAGLLLSRLFAGRLGDKYGADYVIYPALICGIVSLYNIALCRSVWELYLAMTLMGMCVGAFNPLMNVFCILRCSAARRGTATAAFNGSVDLGLGTGSMVAGLFLAKFGYIHIYLAGSVGLILTLLAYTFMLSSLVHRKCN